MLLLLHGNVDDKNDGVDEKIKKKATNFSWKTKINSIKTLYIVFVLFKMF